MNNTIQEYIKKVQEGKIDIVDMTKNVLEKIKKINKEYNYFTVICEDLALELAENIKKDKKNNKNKRLCGLFVSIKDCVTIKDVETTSGSKILNGYKPVFDAHIIKLLKDEGAIIIGKTIQDEFGFGSFSVNVGLDKKIPLNPFDKTRTTGGSSGGAAGITQIADFPHIAIGESTGGSIACPSAFCSVIGMTPTYSLVSRNGLLDYGNSLDKIGVMSKEIEANALVMDVISKKDPNDPTNNGQKEKLYPIRKNEKNQQKIKIGIIKETTEGIEDEIKKEIMRKIQTLNKKYEITEISLPMNAKLSVSTYYIIAVSEASTNLAKYCGLRYGIQEYTKDNFNDYFTKIRSENLGKEAKRRIMLGTFARMSGYRDAYYLKALKVRTLLIKEYKKAFENVDVLLCPTMPIFPPKFDEIKKLTPLQNYLMDIMTVGPNLAGLPHLSLPLKTRLPAGIMLIGDHFCENTLYSVGIDVLND